MGIVYDYNSHPANKGINYEFSGSISEEVLKNYLSRSMIYAGAVMEPDIKENFIRLALSTGAKYIARAGCYWNPAIEDEASFPLVRELIERVHCYDPEIIFEACFFECVTRSVEEIYIPDWVFEAFGMKPEGRRFELERLMFDRDGEHCNYRTMWGENAGVPDITKTEAQMLLYYRACCYIELGFEALHFGQVHLIGAEDEGWVCYTRVLNMIREYAKKRARRGVMLMNAHTKGIIGADGMLLCDFHAYPMRGKVPDGSVDHRPTEDNPQNIIFEPGWIDSIYQRSLGGKTHQGWSCDSLPYFVEIDNYDSIQHMEECRDKAHCWNWGYDEISWFANQPGSFRKKWINYAYERVRELDPHGSFEMCGRRGCVVWKNDILTDCRTYLADNPVYADGGFGEENTIRSIWIKDRDKRVKD